MSLESVNGFVSTPATYKGSSFVFDGTSLGLTLEAIKIGCLVGETVCVRVWGRSFKLVKSGGGSRTPNSVWMVRA